MAQCDRAFPCSNCIARKKQSACHYENESARKQQLLEEGASTSTDDGGAFSTMKLEGDSAAQVTSFGYASNNSNSNTTLGLFRRIEDHDADTPSVISKPPPSSANNGGLREKYKSLIRQLPSKPYIEKLVDTFFREVNYHNYSIDEAIFRDHLRDWHNLSFSTLNKGPLGLSGDLQFFPGLLFQILALALQFQHGDYDAILDSLKYAAGMSFDDLASDYSESGVQILCLLGKRHTTLVTVQAGFLRTSYLKNCGMITESWHSLSQTIRDAQEIGLHKISADRPARNAQLSAEDVLENMWIDQLRRRVWMILSYWDIHMAIILGRPTTIDSRDGKPVLPIDAPIPKNRRTVAPSLRTEADPPTPLTALLWTVELAAPLWDIYSLEKEDPQHLLWPKVERMHKLINQITLHCPPFFRAQNPDTRFDSHPDCYWLPRARPSLQNGAAFTIMALHRPYIFTHAASRTAALVACLDILRAQRTYFNQLHVKDYKLFSLVINTFDAIVVLAAVYILHPCENREHLDSALQHFEWGMERFQMMSGRNSMAKSALGVLKAIHVRLKKALGPGKIPPTTTQVPTPESYAPSSTSSENRTTSQSSVQNVPSGPSTNNRTIADTPQYTQPTISNLTAPAPTPPSASAWERFSGNMLPQQNFDFSSMAPLHPMHDLLYNDLSTIGDTQMLDPQLGSMATTDMGIVDTSEAWQFEGDFGNDSFWGFMNSYNP